MTEAKILTQFFKDQLSNAYDIEAWINTLAEVSADDYDRLETETERLIARSLEANKTRGVVRTSASEYISIPGVYSISFTWSLSLQASVGNAKVEKDLMRIVHDFIGTKIPVLYNGEKFDLCLTFNSPSAFSSSTINGVEYLAVEFGGRALITQGSALANDYTFTLNGHDLTGVLAVNAGVTATGENYTVLGDNTQHSAVRSVSRSFAIQMHAVRGDELTESLINANLGVADLLAGTLTVNGASNNVIVVESGVAFSLGSFVILDIKLSVV